MRPAPNREFLEDDLLGSDDPEQILLRETARALAEAHQLLDRSRSRAGRLETLRTQAASDQDKLITAQSRRIQSLEHQLADLQAFGANQSAALDEAIALVTDLEQRMDHLEHVNAELRLRLARSPAGNKEAVVRKADETRFDTDLDLIRTFGTGDDLTRFNDFVRSAAA